MGEVDFKIYDCAPRNCGETYVLGVKASIGNDTLERRYRRLVIENHPDKLIARGAPKEERRERVAAKMTPEQKA